MAADIQHTLLNLEVTPPPQAWTAIEQWLDAAYDAQEATVAGKLYDYETLPPATAWDNISTALDSKYKETRNKKQGTARVFPLRRIAVAAALAGLIGFSAWYLFSGNINNKTVAQQPVKIPAADAIINSLPTTPQLSANDPAQQATHRPLVLRFHRSVNMMPVSIADNDEPSVSVEMCAAAPGNVHPMNISHTPSVTAPPIRDAEGHIIMDKRLITSPDNNYIIVTGPNGEQTRISTRFLQWINALNSDMQPQEYFDMIIRGDSLWKQRFKEWRSKMIQQGSFAPDVANFLDIVELKELIENTNQ